jgi:hypothetical protein
MKEWLQILIFLWVSLSVVCSLSTIINANREVNTIQHIFHWLISPIIGLLGLIFIDKGRKKYFFEKMNHNLFIK